MARPGASDWIPAERVPSGVVAVRVLTVVPLGITLLPLLFPGLPFWFSVLGLPFLLAALAIGGLLGDGLGAGSHLTQAVRPGPDGLEIRRRWEQLRIPAARLTLRASGAAGFGIAEWWGTDRWFVLSPNQFRAAQARFPRAQPGPFGGPPPLP